MSDFLLSMSDLQPMSEFPPSMLDWIGSMSEIGDSMSDFLLSMSDLQPNERIPSFYARLDRVYERNRGFYERIPFFYARLDRVYERNRGFYERFSSFYERSPT
ncbi:hypothetical protein [Metabacillus arenae]|uniref:Uncharacterized protein n=1 Tax=Metabacillus arenae TaxID=2771434 RepID=A0A926RZY0_9BACI|nr:hypothetical protein [Metabacillus arenae]MBD1383626.1 hypothetical protein [Metabacillus arenae]